jgi:hypothetical protein
MLVFIDESGTHRQGGYSVIALICIASTTTLEKLNHEVLLLEQAIGTTYFHWAYRGWPFRHDFVLGIAKLDFTIRIAQLANPIILDQSLANILPYLLPERTIEQLFIDGKKSKHYQRTLKKLLRDKGISVKKLRTVNDISYPGIRVADAVAGTHRYYLDHQNKRATELYNALEPKLEFTHIQK